MLKIKVLLINGEIWTWEPMGSLVMSLSQKMKANKTRAMVISFDFLQLIEL